MRDRRVQARATALRKNMTDAENRLWRHLRRRQIHGYKIRRQHPVGPFVADFACLEAAVIVEVDGGQHAERSEEDRRRTEYLSNRGFRVLGFWNNEVLQQTDACLEVISNALNSAPTPALPRKRGRGK